ncbi:alkylhydroperoxidase like protein, AhpD family [Gluconacetobacter diazotrophicus PA1 5]|uniref:Carboxymuconolactone decarboxylase family protein n=2 Tax=Gluconacetobacter diazotrophicus TaxID=33996 RepID=A0A7W4I5D9_GLUDI|nr:carboxymuconolactone decarboxylase family protein [Gluconacetobacter diazotrophicus]ACI51875.1 alkylhydroperoxidase like protein, AhpD family [Gluconacetobacter diazotrophicus PA1 5]MBB2155570.1 carboxymuconolactone decarboxylase family protein [Gluconacetobacter diazotrophicus]TWB11220.1 AhpD family alkylhydroperoxidase [Gluconacetobacter diazotrophicus]CAP55356.1 putative carboxymuconolactone decarboxylase protein [Gluconacetobacter diazotrophicus PA1 5]
MIDWSAYRRYLGQTMPKLAALTPGTVEGLTTLEEAAVTTGRLDAKTRELIALAVAVTTRCDGCIAVHSRAAVDAGATKEEIAEALGVAVALNAGAAAVYSTRVIDAVQKAAEAG